MHGQFVTPLCTVHTPHIYTHDSRPSSSNLMGCAAYSPASKATSPSHPFHLLHLLFSSISWHASYQLLITVSLKAAPTDAEATDCRGAPAAAGGTATAASWQPLQLRLSAECYGCRDAPSGTEAEPVVALRPNIID